MARSRPINWRAYPLAYAAGCVALGITVAHLTEWSLGFWAVLVALPLTLFVLGRYQARKHLISLSGLCITTAAIAAFVVLGGTLATLQNMLPPHHIAHLKANGPETVHIHGTIVSPIRSSRFSQRFTFAADKLLGTDTLRTTGRVEITLVQPRRPTDRPFPDLEAGMLVSLRGMLEDVPQRRNPADFDYGGYLKHHGIHATMRVTDASTVHVSGNPENWLLAQLARLQNGIRSSLEKHAPTRFTRDLLSALLLGDRSTLDPSIRDTFRQTGLTHLLAISGLHVMLLGFVVHALLKSLLLRVGLTWFRMELLRSFLTLVVLVAYVLVSGAQPSAIRATMMGIALMGGHIVQRPTEPINTLGLAALILLLFEPNHLFAPGFQLSFAAVGALVSLIPVFRAILPNALFEQRGLKWLTDITLASVSATLGTLPVLLVHFGYVSFAGLLLNIAAIPLTTFLLGAGVFLILFTPVDSFATLFGYAADALARVLRGVAEFGDVFLGWASIHHYVDDVWIISTLVLGLLTIVHVHRPRYRWRLLAACMFCLVASIWVDAAAGRFEPKLDVIFFDVGQGDAALVRTPRGHHILIDAGPRTPYTDAGARTLVPHLERYGVHHLDAVLITHAHADHIGGLPTLLRTVSIGRVLHNGIAGTSRLYEEVVHLTDSLGVLFEAVSAGDTLDLDPSVLAHILWPTASQVSPEDANNGSVVLRLAFGETRFLFTGDIEEEAEAYVTEYYAPLLESDVIKVPHHGSRTSSTLPFVEEVEGYDGKPPLAIVSVAARNRFGLPNEDVLTRWKEDADAHILTTAQEGAIWLRTDGTTVEHIKWQ